VLPRCISLNCVANLVAENGKVSHKFDIFAFTYFLFSFSNFCLPWCTAN